MKTFFRLLSPIWINPIKTIPNILLHWLICMYDIWLLWYINKVLESLNNQTISWLWPITLVFILLSIIYLILLKYSTFFRRSSWILFIYDKLIHIVLNNFFLFNQKSIDKIGTAWLHNIIETWINSRSITLRMIVFSWWPLLISLWIFLRTIWIVIWWYIIFVIVWFVFIGIWIFYYNKYLFVIKQWFKFVSIKTSNFFLNLIRWRQEILWANKIKKEISIIKDIIYKESLITETISPWMNTFFNIPTYIGLFLRIGIVVIIFIIWQDYVSFTFFVTLFIAIGMLESALYKSIETIRSISDMMIDIQALRDMIDKTPQINLSKWKPCLIREWKITFKNCCYWYEKKSIFNNFSYIFEWWKTYALVWWSGSWKSTLIKMIAWPLYPDTWEIFVDKQKLSECSLWSYYLNVWYLTQDPIIFAWSIYENLMYSTTFDYSSDEIYNILKKLNCLFLYDLPDWLNTIVGEKWSTLSWWQRQRIAIARIMFKNPQIVLLDEPTSALDIVSEQKVTDAIEILFKNRTVIIVAHRLKTVINAHKILYFENWKILEEWTHEELMSLSWKYKKMIDLQSWF